MSSSCLSVRSSHFNLSFFVPLLDIVTAGGEKDIRLDEVSYLAFCIPILQRLQANLTNMLQTAATPENCTIEIHQLVVWFYIQNAPRTNHKTNGIGTEPIW